MKKLLCVLMAAAVMGSLCSCGNSGQTAPNNSPNTNANTNTNTVTSSSDVGQSSVITRTHNLTVSSPNESISFEEACRILDTCNMEMLGLPQSVSDFQKYYFGTVDYYSKPYYSIYLYTENDDKKVFVGSNVLVSCDGELVLVKDWLGHYEKVEQNTADSDKALSELYPDAKKTPVEALKILADTNLDLQYPLSQYVFEVDRETKAVNGIDCFIVTPKVEYTDSIQLQQKLYITSDNSDTVFKSVSGEYIALK